MLKMGISKDVILILVGGLVTFLVTLLINKIQSKKPLIVWRILPPVSFVSQGLMAFNVNIENRGSKSARNLKAVINFPQDAKIDSFEVQTSEKAMTYEILKSDNANKFEIYFPYFNKGLECILVFLIKNVNVPNIDISIVGDEDVIGAERGIISPVESSTIWRLIIKFNFFTALLIMALVAFVKYTDSLERSNDNYLQQMDIAEVYFENGKYDLALKEYGKIYERWWLHERPRLYYKTALTYAALNDTGQVILYLTKIKQNDEILFRFALTDKAFDNMRNAREFIMLISDTVQTK
jgi:hypothetical protein